MQKNRNKYGKIYILRIYLNGDTTNTHKTHNQSNRNRNWIERSSVNTQIENSNSFSFRSFQTKTKQSKKMQSKSWQQKNSEKRKRQNICYYFIETHSSKDQVFKMDNGQVQRTGWKMQKQNKNILHLKICDTFFVSLSIQNRYFCWFSLYFWDFSQFFLSLNFLDERN